MTDRLHISDESSSTSKLAAMSSTSSNGSGSGGLSARLEARLNAATRRTQALADAVEESLASSALPSSAAGLEGGGAAGGLPTLPALPTPLRSLVAQLLAVGGGQQQQQPEEEKEARPSAPVLVELRGAGLGRGMSRDRWLGRYLPSCCSSEHRRSPDHYSQRPLPGRHRWGAQCR